MIQRHKPLRRLTPLKRTALFRGNRTPIKKVSSKRRVESRIYSAKRKAFLTARPWCEICIEEDRESASGRVLGSQDVHHVCGRLGGNFLNETTWMALCRKHHDWIHTHPSKAREKGWLK